MRRLISLAMMAAGAAACSGGDGAADAGPEFERPQIWPDRAPLCLSYDLVRVGEVPSIPIQLENRGRQQLVIESAELVGDTRGFFTRRGPDRTVVETYDEALIQIDYRPTEPGWDYAELVIVSNAQNYPTLRVSVLARAAPEGDVDGGVSSWDAGPKPAAATGADGGEACGELDAGP